MKSAAQAAGIQIVTGDTKVVQKGKGDGCFINTSGIGVIDRPVNLSAASCRPGDAVIVSGPIGSAVVEDLRDNVPIDIIAARFNNTLAQMIAETCGIVRSRAGHNTVALSGGVFQNMLLLDRTVRTLNERDFRVLIHHNVPTNDGGISLGQAAIAVARDSIA